MKRWISLLASWVFLLLGIGLCAMAVTAGVTNIGEERRFRRYDDLDARFEKSAEPGGDLDALRAEAASSQERIGSLTAELSKVNQALDALDDSEDTVQTIVVSTAENKVQVRRSGNVVFEAICSTGKGTTFVDRGRKRVFSTPTGKFEIVSKEENPVWVPPDWHYVEEARKKGLEVVRLETGDTIDAASGTAPAPPRAEGFWSPFRGQSEPAAPPGKVLRVEGDTIIEVENGVERELPSGEMIRVGNSIVIPPLGVKQRRFHKVLGSYRLNLGDGYALHGTQQTSQLGQSVSHGCVRLGDEDIEALYKMVNVGDEVIMY
jgi:lipoprotein-anchoring transpeptidase ErfK/SrfK